MFNKVLIANRGEIACRIMKTCRRLGIGTVAVYSEADRCSRHVRLADEAYWIGPAPSIDSYLQAPRVLEAAARCGADAIHPGYGFLAENAAFAEACAGAGIAFVGPPAQAIRAMGSKAAAKALMAESQVPLVPGYHGERQDAEFLRQQADRIGYPVLIKAIAGGGGKGMRVVASGMEFEAALASCRREAQAGFGDDRVLIERYLLRPRHIEIQVFGDTHDNIIHLHERDCSAQRRHQKVAEEAPAPGMTLAQRAAMGRAACEAARAVGYVGAGTVEFIVDAEGAFYFMEMNTRLQVEHPVTEMITGLDLVEWQLRIAAGAPLPLAQDQVPLRGHALEVRVYAEEPERGFLPSTGTLLHFVPPEADAHTRVDSGVEQGDAISPYYDPMLAKLIVWGQSRDQAISRMLMALRRFEIAGVGNNIEFLARLVGHPSFRAGQVDTGLIERESLYQAQPLAAAEDAVDAAALWVTLEDRAHEAAAAAGSCEPHSPWALADGWRMSGTHTVVRSFLRGETPCSAAIRYDAAGLALGRGAVTVHHHKGYRLCFTAGTVRHEASILRLGRQLHVFSGGRHYDFHLQDPDDRTVDDPFEAGLSAPMPGKIVALLVAPGTRVDKGAAVLVLEAMKMEHTLCAPAAGTVREFLCAVGQQVAEGAELVDFQSGAED